MIHFKFLRHQANATKMERGWGNAAPEPGRFMQEVIDKEDG
jgi:hypothetical protein